METPCLTGVGHSVPDTFITIEEALREHRVSKRTVGVYERFFGQRTVARRNPERDFDHVITSAREALEESGSSRVTHIFYAHTINYPFPREAGLVERVREELGAYSAGVFLISQLNCTSGLYAVDLARRIVARDRSARALVICGERALLPRSEFISNVIVMGEAFAACVIENADGPRLGESLFTVHGRFHRGEDMEQALRRDYDAKYVPHMAATVAGAIERGNVTSADIGAVFPHNVNRLSWNNVLAEVGLAKTILKDTAMSTYGHCFTADFLINLHSFQRGGGSLPAVSLMCSSGLGATFGTVLLYG